jgi:hypothetical protein
MPRDAGRSFCNRLSPGSVSRIELIAFPCWMASESTRIEYAARMNRVVESIEAHLADTLDRFRPGPGAGRPRIQLLFLRQGLWLALAGIVPGRRLNADRNRHRVEYCPFDPQLKSALRHFGNCEIARGIGAYVRDLPPGCVQQNNIRLAKRRSSGVIHTTFEVGSSLTALALGSTTTLISPSIRSKEEAYGFR